MAERRRNSRERGANPGTGALPCRDAEGALVVESMGTVVITTLTQEEFDGGPATNPLNLSVGEAAIKNLAPGKYGVIVIPPAIDDDGNPVTWVQTTTIEGTPTIDAWVKANEPAVFVEGFGTGFKHGVFGYVKSSPGEQTIGGADYAALPWYHGPFQTSGWLGNALAVSARHSTNRLIGSGGFASSAL